MSKRTSLGCDRSSAEPFEQITGPKRILTTPRVFRAPPAKGDGAEPLQARSNPKSVEEDDYQVMNTAAGSIILDWRLSKRYMVLQQYELRPNDVTQPES